MNWYGIKNGHMIDYESKHGLTHQIQCLAQP